MILMMYSFVGNTWSLLVRVLTDVSLSVIAPKTIAVEKAFYQLELLYDGILEHILGNHKWVKNPSLIESTGCLCKIKSPRRPSVRKWGGVANQPDCKLLLSFYILF